jgi:hypothetical protein
VRLEDITQRAKGIPLSVLAELCLAICLPYLYLIIYAFLRISLMHLLSYPDETRSDNPCLQGHEEFSEIFLRRNFACCLNGLPRSGRRSFWTFSTEVRPGQFFTASLYKI